MILRRSNEADEADEVEVVERRLSFRLWSLFSSEAGPGLDIMRMFCGFRS